MYISLLLVTLVFSVSIAAPIVSTPNGYIRGTELKTNINTTYYAFWNIPYGKPPVGDLRFQAPRPAGPWSGIRDGTNEGNSCVYMNYYEFYPDPGIQTEDCLYVSVYTPNLNTSAKLPVMFWIYGGGFRAGSGIFKFYGPQNVINENVIVVTFNYRLGPLGFLSTGDTVMPGNAGLKDQLLALQWTKSNIEYFGGDPRRVTIFGESAGGMSVGLHLVSKKSAGLFRGAICHSGCTLSTTLSLDPRAFIYNYTNFLNAGITQDNSTKEIRDFLITVPVELLMNYALQVDQHLFVPVLEVESDEAFITEPLYGLVENGKVNGEALLIGTTSEEALGFISEDKLLQTAISYDENNAQLIPAQITPKNEFKILDSPEFIKNIYLNDSNLFQNNLGQFLEPHEEIPKYKVALCKLMKGQNFKIIATIKERIGAGKVGHFSELSYLFNMTQYPLKTEADDLTRRKIAKLWANFATYLDPTPQTNPLLDNVILPKSEPENLYLLDIDTNLTVIAHPEKQRLASWTEYWQKYVKRPYLTF